MADKTREEIARKEGSRDPIFLLQSRNIMCVDRSSYEYDSDQESLVDSEGHPVDDQDLLDRGDAVEVWTTESVWLDREEATAFAGDHSYRYPAGWRVYCDNAEGRLAELLKQNDAFNERERCIAAVDAEPELPGDMPPALAEAVAHAIMNEDADFFIHALRLAVRMTKDGIRKRIVSG